MKKLLLALATTILLLGCSEEPPARPVVGVVVDDVLLEPYRPKSTYVGRLLARDDVAIQAQVTGYLKSRDFREGELVHRCDGRSLFGAP